jgi:hypothetical protein
MLIFSFHSDFLRFLPDGARKASHGEDPAQPLPGCILNVSRPGRLSRISAAPDGCLQGRLPGDVPKAFDLFTILLFPGKFLISHSYSFFLISLFVSYPYIILCKNGS